MPHQNMNEFGSALAREEWKTLQDRENTSEAVEEFEETNEVLLNNFLPTKKVNISSIDKPWITAELKMIKRQRQRIYRREGKSDRYKRKKKEFDDKKKEAVKKYKEKWIKELKEGTVKSIYKSLR